MHDTNISDLGRFWSVALSQDNIYSKFKSRQRDGEWRSQSGADQGCGTAGRDEIDMTGESQRSLSPSGGLASWRLRRATEYLEADLSKSIDLGRVAQLSGLSLSHFARAFKASTGMPPYRWVLQARIKRAQELLDEGAQPITAISLELGFVDQSHFTRAFRRLTGSTPRRWQRDHRRQQLLPNRD
jgi:AraC-like DNA-binding protein